MAERSIPYDIITPLGTLQFNRNEDTEFMWFEDPPTGMDAAKLRHEILDLAQADGAVVPAAYREAIYPAFKGLIVVEADVGRDWFDLTERRIMSDLLRARLGSLGTADGTLKWLPSGSVHDSAITATGNEITDATRVALVQGDGVTAPDSSYGIWETSTNYITNGGLETNTTGWTAVGSTLTRVTTVKKFGAAGGQIVTNNAGANEGGYHSFTTPGSLSGGVGFMCSVWMRRSGVQNPTVRLRITDNAGATIVTGTPITLTSTYQRLSLLLPSPATTTTYRFYIETDVQQAVTYFFDGVQAENQPLVTPYIETNGGTATRGAAAVDLPASAIDETQGWVAMRIRPRWPGSAPPHGLSGGIQMFHWGTTTSDRVAGSISVQSGVPSLQTIRRTGGSGPGETEAEPLTHADGEAITAVFAWEVDRVRVAGQGRAFEETTTLVAPPVLAATTFVVGSDPTSGTARQIDGEVLWIACGTGTLTDDDSATFHAFGDADPSFSDLPGEQTDADATLLWTADDGFVQMPEWRQRTVRLFDGPEIEEGGMLDPFAFALVAGDPLAYSEHLQTSADIACNGAAVSVTNGGLAPTWPLLRIYGAVTSPILKNNTTGERVELDINGGLVIANGDYIEIDTHPLVQTVVHSDGSHKVAYLDRAVSSFWNLAVGANLIEFDGSSPSGAVKAVVIWRDAWYG